MDPCISMHGVGWSVVCVYGCKGYGTECCVGFCEQLLRTPHPTPLRPTPPTPNYPNYPQLPHTTPPHFRVVKPPVFVVRPPKKSIFAW